jgi:hypothetical protein
LLGHCLFCVSGQALGCHKCDTLALPVFI